MRECTGDGVVCVADTHGKEKDHGRVVGPVLKEAAVLCKETYQRCDPVWILLPMPSVGGTDEAADPEAMTWRKALMCFDLGAHGKSETRIPCIRYVGGAMLIRKRLVRERDSGFKQPMMRWFG